ncbi:MAG TPA: malonate decarboxylase subunit alpha [Terriglobales bacterium]|nr:malonate decarboxylase subunit alpha [Terriglobales bacterium]
MAHTVEYLGAPARWWTTRVEEKKRRLGLAASWMTGAILRQEKIVEALELLIAPTDRIVIEGDNQKQADFLSRSLVKVDPKKVHELHLIISSISRPEHLTLFEMGIAKKVDFAFAGPQSLRVAQLLEDGVLEIGAIHTYVELYARLFLDLVPNVVLVCAEEADSEGNLYTGPNTEDTPVIVEAAAFHDGIVIVQVNRIVDKLPRVDIPASWVDVVVEADRPYAIEPLFTRDPREINDLQILMAMMVIRGIYERHQVHSLNHGIGFDTAAIELLLPTYGESLGLRGKICEHWALNPHPTLIPAIETGWVKTVHCFGSEVGMDDYIRARPDIFFNGHDGSLRSNRVLCQLVGQYAVDAFIGSTLQIDADANSSTVTAGRISGFGGAPNMGHDPHGRRHASPAWLDLKTNPSPLGRGRKLVVQTVETFSKGDTPALVETLDAVEVGKKAGMPIAPVMIYGDDVSHVVTEEGIAYLYKAEGLEERRCALAAVAGVTPVGLRAKPEETAALRKKGIVAYPEDIGVERLKANRSLLAARSMEDLVAWSDGLYKVPARFRSW